MISKIIIDSMNSNVSVKNFVLDNGERYCHLVNIQTGLPLYYPNLFVTTQIRNNSLSVSAMESALGGIAVLIRFMSERNDDLEARFSRYQFFETCELDALRDYCQNKSRVRKTNAVSRGVFTYRELLEAEGTVRSHTVYVRISVISQYVKWLAEHFAGEGRTKELTLRIDKMVNEIKSRRPVKRNRNSGLTEKGLNEKQLEILFELFRPDSELNPFYDHSVRVRNRLMFLMLYHLGLRGGELLNIRIRDIDFTRNQLVIFRRADEKDDPRIDQPRPKTQDRRLPLKDTLVKEIHSYIINIRKRIVRANQSDYLFVTHKFGPTKGMPISKSGYKKMIKVVQITSPTLYKLTGHQLRHTWNEKFSDLMDSMDSPPNAILQEEIRSNLMGWKLGSGTAAIYNKRFTNRKAQEAALQLQDGKVRLPKGLCDE